MTDERYMRRALELAARAQARTSPNPMVGAVLVRDGVVVGEGFHARAGRPHAEVEALAAAGERARGATLYVTLEPCAHHGRTPPCALAVAAAGVARVVAAVRDPNPRVDGGGFRLLQDSGVEVVEGVLEAEARALNRAFFTWIRRGRPFVTAKYAMTLDGRVATHSGHSQWITGHAARTVVHRERALHDAVLVGVGTVLADDPRLDVRLDPADPLADRRPLRVVLDSRGRTPAGARVLDPALGSTLLATAAEYPGDDGRVDVAAVLRDLARRDVLSVFVEGGPTIHAALLERGLVDRVLAFVAPLGVGGRDAPPAIRWSGQGTRIPVEKARMERVGPDLMWEGML